MSSERSDERQSKRSRSVFLVVGLLFLLCLVALGIIDVASGGRNTGRGVGLLVTVGSAVILAPILLATISARVLALGRTVAKLKPTSLIASTRLAASSRGAYFQLTQDPTWTGSRDASPMSLVVAASTEGVEFWTALNRSPSAGSIDWSIFSSVTEREIGVWPFTYPMLRMELRDGSALEFVVISPATRGAVRSGKRRVLRLAANLEALRSATPHVPPVART